MPEWSHVHSKLTLCGSVWATHSKPLSTAILELSFVAFPMQDLVDDYYCACVEGWEGKDCKEERDECATDPCVNGDCMVRP